MQASRYECAKEFFRLKGIKKLFTLSIRRVLTYRQKVYAFQLLENGSKQEDLWGINLYPEREFDDWIEFYSIINLRPAMGNRSCNIGDIEIKRKIYKIVNKLVER